MKSVVVKQERWINLAIKLSGYSSILFVTMILLFLLREGLPALGDVSCEPVWLALVPD